MRLIQFGTAELISYNADDSFQANARVNFTDVAQGAIDRDGALRYAKASRVTRSFVFTETETDVRTIDEQALELTREISKGRALLVATTRNNVLYHTWAKVSGIRTGFAPGDGAQQQYALTFEIAYPFWINVDQEPLYMDNGLLMDAGLLMDIGNAYTTTINGAVEAFTIENAGGTDLTRGQIIMTVQAASSAAVIKITNTTNSMEVTLTQSLTAGDLIIIDFLALTVTVNGSDAYANFSYGADQWPWMVLSLGDNDIQIDTTSLVGTIEFSWAYAEQRLI